MPEGSQDAEVTRLVREGDLLGKGGDWAGALARYDQGTARAPRSARAHYHRAIALSKLGRRTDLAAALEQVLSLDPEHERARAGLSRLRGRSRPSPASSDAAPAAPGPQGPPRALGDDGIPVDWEAGDVILDLYEVKGVAGEGGMGKVYRALHRGWNLELAIKSPRPEVFAKSGGADKFVQEAETWVNLGLHPHIASCFYVRTLGGVPRIFAEYVEGGSLENWITKRKLYEGGPDEALRRILDIAIQFAWGLGYAHEKGLIHQDVKPANVLMTPEGDVKVTDFGLAGARAAVEPGARDEGTRWLGQTGKPGAEVLRSILVSCGGLTPAYCSPEQARKQKLTRRADLWSWAVSVLEMFTGGVGWMSGLAAPDVLATYREEGPEDAALPRMPDGVAELLERSFQADPAARPHDMAEVAKALRETYQKIAGEPYSREEPEAAKLLADALNNRAVSFIDLGRNDQAEKALDQALAADPAHLHATYNQGLLLWRARRMTDEVARTRIREACLAHSDAWEGPYLAAWIEIERGDEEAARSCLGEAECLAGAQEGPQRQIVAASKRVRAGWRCLRTLVGHRDWVHADSQAREDNRREEDLGVQIESVNDVSLTPDGRLAVSGSGDGTLRVWDVATGRCLRTLAGHRWGVCAVSLTPDGRLAVSGGCDKTLWVWDVATGRCLRTLEGHTGEVNDVSLTPDGRLAVSGSGDKTLRVWDVSTGQCLGTLEGHTDGVTAVSLTPDGRLAVSGSADKTLRVWYLDWELVPREPADWDEAARPFLGVFLSCHTPIAEDGVTRRGRASWTDADFDDLYRELQWAGLGWLRKDGVRAELAKMAETWKGPPPLA